MKVIFRSIFLTLVFASIGLTSSCDKNPAPDGETDSVKPKITASELATTNNTTTPAQVCAADSSWVTNPNPPDEIPGGGENFCQFYQFAWQWFLYLMTPSSDDPNLRNFQVAQDYPILQIEGDSCASTSTEPVFFVRTMKEPDADAEFVLPERIGQAGGGATIYDQQKNVVFYSVYFGRDLCSAPASGDLPANTTELKIAWKVITDAEKADYLWIKADVIPDNNSDVIVEETLGLIGYHLVRGTAQHPELVWASFEHKNNAPNCVDPASAPAGGWSFLSASCEACLNDASDSCFSACAYNQAKKASSLHGEPSEICRIFPEGTAPGDNKGEENIADVTALNAQLVGPEGILTSLPSDNPMAIVANYFNIGALWVSDPSQPATSSNQRGSLQLANPVMETTFQGSLSVSGSSIQTSTTGVVNCFACHTYTPGETATSGLSHIFDDIKQQQTAQ